MRSTAALRMFRATPRMMRPVPKEDQAAVVVGFAVCAAGYSCGRKFFVDKTLRLQRQGPGGREH
ncbi:hypothetical protein GMORB2_5514 [Geosmithia morbida]|uniref:Uncharacterized protein n=1 Tax=Geosmithia morbida TaxID=1094350 RepID=A0A9P5D1E4_9HYPO|nr:uncharacterized protein GMORB2_5514 [Geosmithia morbida]KAF4123798.1 hypothetical protein GMORB2_5514 [Geosmithia morbida]